MKKLFLSFLILVLPVVLCASVRLTGRVFDELNNVPIAYATVKIFDSDQGTISDENGEFRFENIDPGEYRLEVSYVGYKDFISEFIYIHFGTQYIEIAMVENTTELDGVTVVANPFLGKDESPMSYRRISPVEIELNPGANRDISKVVQSFPGVASTVSYRNDLIVRGGSPAENAFYLNGIEIPNLNHFATQGASGGPVGIINADLIREVDFLSGAFPANRGDVMSSVMDLKLIKGSEQTQGKFTIGASEVSLGLEGKIKENTDYIFSIRRSYLQFLFEALDLPFLPTFNDLTFKIQTQLSERTELTFLGIGAYDVNELNLDVTEDNDTKYLLATIPYQTQWSYTTGVALKHYFDKSYINVILSNNHLHNNLYKYLENENDDPSKQILDYNSNENEIKMRVEHVYRKDNLKFLSGGGLQYVFYNNSTVQSDFVDNMPTMIDYSSSLDFLKYSLFEQVTYFSNDNLLVASAGLRIDGNTYSDQMRAWDQISPRISAAFNVATRWKLTATTGLYYQLPAYTMLGYRDNLGELVNKNNHIQPISSLHSGVGVEWTPINHALFSLEGFYKKYDDYPMSLIDSVSMASKGGGYELFGDEEVNSTSHGRAYGLELMGRWNGHKGLNFIAAYTWVRSEFSHLRSSDLLPSAWDNKHLFSFSGTKSIGKQWHIGMKIRAQGGAPFTPNDIETSSLVDAWDASGFGYLDYSRFNAERLEGFTQIDLRVDKDFYFEKWMLGIYIDVQNILNSKYDAPPVLIQEVDASGNPIIVNPTAPAEEQRYSLQEIELTSGTILPTMGIMVEF